MMSVKTWTPETYSAENARNNRVDAVIYPDHVSIDCQITGCAKRETALRRFWQALESAEMTGGLCMADVNAMLSDVSIYIDGFYTIGVEYSDDAGFYVWFSYKTEAAERPAENSAPDYAALTDTIRAELKRKHGGAYEPNSRETWLDVQARALYQACNRIRTICRTNGLYCKGVQ